MISASWCQRLKKNVRLRASIPRATRPAVAERFGAAVLAARGAAAKPQPAARMQRAVAYLQASGLRR